MNSTAAAKLTIPALKAFHRRADVVAAVLAVKVSRAASKAMAEKVDAYIAPLFARPEFDDIVDADKGARITNVDRMYLCTDDAACGRFYAACDTAHKANGFDITAGYCPALMASHEVTKAERVLVALISEFMGTDIGTAAPKLREQALELFLNPPRA